AGGRRPQLRRVQLPDRPGVRLPPPLPGRGVRPPDGRLRPVGQHRRRRRADPEGGRRSRLRPRLPAADDRLRPEDGQDRRQLPLAGPGPHQPVRLLPVLGQRRRRRRRETAPPLHLPAGAGDRPGDGGGRGRPAGGEAGAGVGGDGAHPRPGRVWAGGGGGGGPIRWWSRRCRRHRPGRPSDSDDGDLGRRGLRRDIPGRPVRPGGTGLVTRGGSAVGGTGRPIDRRREGRRCRRSVVSIRRSRCAPRRQEALPACAGHREL
ncbi:MAG: Tyrosyl-tRNA synthetase, partial [uncultured Thermomicrobiales bacterium]